MGWVPTTAVPMVLRRGTTRVGQRMGGVVWSRGSEKEGAEGAGVVKESYQGPLMSC